MKAIIPRKFIKNGKAFYYVRTPSDLNGGNRNGKRRIFQTESAAKDHCEILRGLRDDRRMGVEALPAAERAIAGMAIKKVGGVERLLRAVDFFLEHNNETEKTVTDLVHEFIADRKRRGLTKSYIGPLSVRLRQFSIRFGREGAHTIKAQQISKWLDECEWAAETKFWALKDLRTLYGYAVGMRYTPSNPALAIDPPKVTRKPPCILSVDDALRLMRAAEAIDRGLIPYLALILFGGLRPEESHRCRWDYVKADVIDLPAGKSKNNKRRLVELATPAMDTLRAWLALSGDMPATNLRKRLDAVRDAAAWVLGGPYLPVWGHDILRHSFVSYAVPIHGVKDTSLMADHSETVLNRHYRELVRKSDAERFWKILPAITPQSST